MKPVFYSFRGFGVGLRSPHYPVITREWPAMDWFEAITENYMDTGGRPLRILEEVRHHYPIALHGTSLSIGSTDPLDEGYLARWKKLVDRIDPFIVSDHLCWCGVNGEALFDLLPLPFTEEAIRHVVRRIDRVQEYLGRPILLENVSAYVTYKHSTMPEWEFLTQVAKRSGCGILLDLNNIYVNAVNHKFDAHTYIENIPTGLVGQFHLAGHTDMGTYLFDTHSDHVIDPVWKLYEKALAHLGSVSALIEWDDKIPPFEELVKEADRARKIYQEYERRGPETAPNIVKGEGNPTPEYAAAPSLSQTQSWFKARVRPREKEQGRPDSAQTLLNPQGGVPGEERIRVYAEGYPARIHETLKEVYESVHQVLGDGNFCELAQAYAFRYPTGNYNLNYAGRHLAEFLEKSPHLKTFPFLSDLARLEWQIWRAFHAFDEPPLKPDEIQNLAPKDWENTLLKFQPSVSLIRSDWPILDIWLEREKKSEEVRREIIRRTERILIGRREVQVRCELLDEYQSLLLEDLLAGKTLGEACGHLAEAAGDELPPVTEWFQRWIRDGLIQALRCPVSPLTA